MKKKAKKIWSLFLVVVMLFVTDTRYIYASASQELWVYSEECPDSVITYAKESYVRHLITAVESGMFTVGEVVALGKPFTIATEQVNSLVYYFPIMSNDEIIATYRVYQDSTLSEEANEIVYVGIMSKYLANELEELKYSTTQDMPALLFMDDGDVLVELGNTVEILLDEQAENNMSQFSIPECSTSVVSPTIELDTVASTALVSPTAMSKYLSLNIIETQGSGNNWCAAYVTAALIRYCNSNTSYPKALDVMKTIYSNPSNEDSLSRSQVVWAANIFSIYPTVQYGRVDPYSYINASCPLYMSTVDINDSDSYHALALRGYNTYNNTLSIWNPWRSSFETMDASSYEYVANSNQTYKWVYTIYGWPAP